MDNSSKRLTGFLAAIIIIVAFAVRFFWIQQSPPALNWDEAALGYNAYSILTTGKDEFGKNYPLLLRSFDDYKPALYSYLSIPFIRLWGLNEVTVRLVSVLSGTVIVALIYLLALELFKNRRVALLSALAVGFEPWAIHFSRAAFEANLALALTLGGVYLIIKSKFSNYWSVLGVILLTSSLYAYHSGKILLIPVLGYFIYLYRQSFVNHRKVAVWCLTFASLVILPLAITWVKHPETISRANSTLSVSRETPVRFLAYFSPVNLFVRGTPEPTQHIPGFGMFYNFEFIFWLAGLYALWKTQKSLIPLLILAVLPGALTWNWFYPARVMLLFPLYSLIIGLGIFTVFSHLHAKSIKFTVLLAAGVLFIAVNSIANLVTTLLFFLPYEERGNWQYGMKQVVQEIARHEENYAKIVFETRTAQPYIFVLFYSQFPPKIYQSYSKNISSPRNSFNFGKYEFRDVYWDKDKYLPKTLFAGPDSSLPLRKLTTSADVNLVSDVTDFEGNLLYRIAGTK